MSLCLLSTFYYVFMLNCFLFLSAGDSRVWAKERNLQRPCLGRWGKRRLREVEDHQFPIRVTPRPAMRAMREEDEDGEDEDEEDEVAGEVE